MRKAYSAKILGILSIAVAIVIIYVPIVLIFIMSFTNNTSISSIDTKASLKWYASLFTSDYQSLGIASKFAANIPSLKSAILNTFLITILSTIISTILGTFFAIGINSLSKKIRSYFMMMNNMPIINPDIVTGFLLLLVFVLFETTIGLERGFFTVLISHVFFSIPYVILSVLPRLKQIDPNTYEAARDLGCTRFQAIFKAIIPAIMTGIISGAIFAFTMSIDDFVITMFVSGREFYNVSTWIDNVMRRSFIPKTVYAYNVIVFSIAFIAVMLNRLIKKPKKEVHVK